MAIKHLFGMTCLGAMLLALAAPAAGGTIVIVTDNAGSDADMVSFLNTNFPGQTVEAISKKYHDTDGDGFTAADKADLVAAVTVIVSRQTNSGDYDIDVGFWEDLATPIILRSPYLARNSRWDWVNNDGTSTISAAANGGDETVITAAGQIDALFSGLTSPADVYQQDADTIPVAAAPSFGDGVILATDFDDSDIVAARWNAGDDYGADSRVAGGLRIFLAGNTGNDADGLTADGKEVLRRAVAEAIPEPATLALAAIGLLGLRRRRR